MNFTKQEFLNLLEESQTFREIVYRKITLPSLKDRVEAVVRQYPENKIGAIKAVREEFSRNELMKDFSSCVYGLDITTSRLGLAEAKRLVEFVGNY